MKKRSRAKSKSRGQWAPRKEGVEQYGAQRGGCSHFSILCANSTEAFQHIVESVLQPAEIYNSTVAYIEVDGERVGHDSANFASEGSTYIGSYRLV